MNYEMVKLINVSDWNALVVETHKGPYNLQQQKEY